MHPSHPNLCPRVRHAEPPDPPPLPFARAGFSRRWQADTRGVAAIEFALIAPDHGCMMFVGAVELSQAITVDRRVTQIASSTADLVARADKTISQTEITDIMRVGSYILKPYSATPMQIVLRNVTSSPANATQHQAVLDLLLQRHRQHADLRLHQHELPRCRPTW